MEQEAISTPSMRAWWPRSWLRTAASCFITITATKVDYLIDDYDSLSAVPIEVKSGKDYTIHSALSAFVKNEDYHVKKAYVLSNTREITTSGKITYIPIYDVMFLGKSFDS